LLAVAQELSDWDLELRVQFYEHLKELSFSVCTGAVGNCAVDRTAIERVHPDDRQVLTRAIRRALVAACPPKIKIEQSRAQNNRRRGCLNAVSKITATFLKIP
jgi:hypothetical protein